MKLINIGFGSMVSAGRILAVLSPDSAPIKRVIQEAKDRGAIGLFESKYGERVKVYTMGEFSKEICGGPHAENTGDLVSFKIKKEEASSAGIRRIKAILE